MIQLARLPLMACAAMALAMAVAAGATALVTPRVEAVVNAPDLESTVPRAFGDWKGVRDNTVQVAVSQGVETSAEQPYDQTVLRSYANSRGDVVMLALAWGQRQRQDIKVHRPEVCYPAQGLQVFKLGAGAPIALPGRAEPVPTVTMVAGSRGNLEAVRYWIRIGSSYGGDGLAARWYILQEGLRGRIPDGMLVRASQRIRTADEAQRSDVVLQGFLADLSAALPPATLALLVR